MQIQKGPLHSFGAAVPFVHGRGAAENDFLPVCYFRSNLTTTSRYHRYGTMFQIIHSSIRI